MCMFNIFLQFGSTCCDLQDISGGFLNKVYRLCAHEDSSFSVIVKHAPPYVKVSLRWSWINTSVLKYRGSKLAH